jgi:hypothetical protein
MSGGMIGGGGTDPPTTTKGDISGFDTTFARVPVGADGTVLTADSTTALGIGYAAASSGITFNEVVRKTSTQSNGTTTLANDTELKLAIGTSKTFIFQINAFLHETSTSDWKISVTSPTNAIGGWYGKFTSSTGDLHAFGSVHNGSNSTNTAGNLSISGWCTTDGSNSGDIQFQFAKQSGGGGSTDILIGSMAWSADVT